MLPCIHPMAVGERLQQTPINPNFRKKQVLQMDGWMDDKNM